MAHVEVTTTHSGAATGTIRHSREVPSRDSGHLNHHSPSSAAAPPNRDGLVLPLFMATIFLSSLLVFSVQPMFAKMVLPLLGGSPGVWNTAMLFFQIMLLLGYIYAHLTTRLLGIKWQAWLHVSVMALVCFFLPISIAQGWTPPVEEAPVLWLIGLFTVSVGLPFFAVATNAPLLQRWFSHTGHSAAADPYFLYGASNLGSILALLSYPLVFEPLLKSREQSSTWAWSYAVLVGLIVACGVTLWHRYTPASLPLTSVPQAAAELPVSWARRLHWLALALVPSSLLLGVTMHITTDVAAIPLLWVLPLTLYLLTFVIVFARRPWLPHPWMVLAQPFFLIPIGLQQFGGLALNLVLPLMVFFVTTMVCHGELAKRRPSTTHLTEFYLWMSLGGMLGGVFNVLVAPILFSSVFEYPLMLVLACLLRPPRKEHSKLLNAQDLFFPGILLALLGIPMIMGVHPKDFGYIGFLIFFLTMGLATYSFRHRPFRFGLGIATILILTSLAGNQDQILTQERSFFGVNTVQRTEAGDFNLLVHGRTIHGAQHTEPTLWQEPLTYYHQEGPLGQLLSMFQNERSIQHIAAIGLGTGTMACYQKPGQHWTYFEIDPSVVRLAQDTRYFHYLAECGSETNVVFGDGRLSLAKVPNSYYDLLILDAFSSDAIPVHLITREAFKLYFQKLKNEGILMFHISNANLELTGVIANLAEDAQLKGWVQRHREISEIQRENFHFISDWVVISRDPSALALLNKDSRWESLVPDANSRVWTDDFSNILSALKLWSK